MAFTSLFCSDKGDLTIMSEKDDGSGRQNWLLQPINKFTATAPRKLYLHFIHNVLRF